MPRGPSPVLVLHLASRSRRPPPVVEPMVPPPCSPSIIVRWASLPPSPAPSSSRLDTLSLCCSRLPLAPPSSTSARHTCVSRERARMREKWRAGCVARTAETTSTTLAAAAPTAHLLPGQKSIDVPLSGPKRQKSSEKGRARSTRGAGGHQTLPTPWPIGTALAQAPDRSRRRPGSVLHCCTVDFLKKARR